VEDKQKNFGQEGLHHWEGNAKEKKFGTVAKGVTQGPLVEHNSRQGKQGYAVLVKGQKKKKQKT